MLIHEKILQSEVLRANQNVYVSKEIENTISLDSKEENFLIMVQNLHTGGMEKH